MSYIFTSESVSEGHPDKICDQISDAILDECIKQDKYSRVACETMIKNNHVIVGGEITSKADINYEEVAKSVIKDIGYDNKEMGFSHESINFKNLIGKQSEDIHQGISKGDIFFPRTTGKIKNVSVSAKPKCMALAGKPLNIPK